MLKKESTVIRSAFKKYHSGSDEENGQKGGSSTRGEKSFERSLKDTRRMTLKA